MKTRIKLYVSAVNTTFITSDNSTKSVVHLNAAYSPDPNSENHKFWKATPSGTFRLVRNNGHDFLPGQHYYLDITPDEDGSVGLISKEVFEDSIRVILASPNHKTIDGVVKYGVEFENFEMTITNRNAWSVFENNRFSVQMTKI